MLARPALNKGNVWKAVFPLPACLVKAPLTSTYPYFPVCNWFWLMLDLPKGGFRVNINFQD